MADLDVGNYIILRKSERISDYQNTDEGGDDLSWLKNGSGTSSRDCLLARRKEIAKELKKRNSSSSLLLGGKKNKPKKLNRSFSDCSGEDNEARKKSKVGRKPKPKQDQDQNKSKDQNKNGNRQFVQHSMQSSKTAKRRKSARK